MKLWRNVGLPLEMIKWQRAAINNFSLDSREIILLREYEELSYQEIAALLDCLSGTVMSRLARARSKLRDLSHTHLQDFLCRSRE